MFSYKGFVGNKIAPSHIFLQTPSIYCVRLFYALHNSAQTWICAESCNEELHYPESHTLIKPLPSFCRFTLQVHAYQRLLDLKND